MARATMQSIHRGGDYALRQPRRRALPRRAPCRPRRGRCVAVRMRRGRGGCWRTSCVTMAPAGLPSQPSSTSCAPSRVMASTASVAASSVRHRVGHGSCACWAVLEDGWPSPAQPHGCVTTARGRRYGPTKWVQITRSRPGSTAANFPSEEYTTQAAAGRERPERQTRPRQSPPDLRGLRPGRPCLLICAERQTKKRKTCLLPGLYL